jgi:alcohol dehydrogenase
MSNFVAPTKMVFGRGTAAAVGGEAVALGASQVLLVTDLGVYNAGLTKAVEESLQSKGVGIHVFNEVEVDPSLDDVARGVKMARAENCDLIVVVGGGSPICAGKGIALVLANGGELKDYAGENKAPRPSLPLIVLPTTAGSGSEVSPNFQVHDHIKHIKYALNGKYYPQVAILDPLLLLTLPYWQAICSSFDALTHAVEAYTSNRATPASDAMALEAVRLMYQHLIPAAATTSVESREKQLLASSMANIACGNAGLGLVHAFTYGMEELPHGYACGLVLPFAMEYNLPVVPEKTAALARAMGVPCGLPIRETAYQGLMELRRFYREVGFPNRITEQELPRGREAERVEKILGARLIRFNARRVDKKDVERLLDAAYQGWTLD